MQHACYAAVGLLLNLLPAETARMQITKVRLHTHRHITTRKQCHILKQT